ncbi:ricin-type beta-trefoil lectin domain protein [Streptomyces liangshanensis]
MSRVIKGRRPGRTVRRVAGALVSLLVVCGPAVAATAPAAAATTAAPTTTGAAARTAQPAAVAAATCWATHYGAEIPPGSFTASGEIFDMNALTAATSLSLNPQLPFGTMVKVTNVANNASVTVRINDRGSFASTAGAPFCIDLSDGAFQRIGAISPDPGHFNVTLEVLSGNGGGGGTPTGATGPIRGFGGKCVDVNAASSADGTAVQLYDCNGTGAQNWTAASDGTLRALGKCLDVSSGSTANGAQVQLWTCNGSGAQKWQRQGNGQVVNPQSGKCLDATGNSSANLTRLQIWDCFGAPNQLWTLPS